MLEKQQLSGVSPVIGIILMVAVTVGLVALASTIVFDLGSNVNEPADVSANLEFDEEANEVVAEVIRNENAQSISLRVSDKSHVGTPDPGFGTSGNEYEFVDKSGETGTTVVGTGSEGTAEIVATVGETGNEQVIQTVEYNGA